MMYEGEKQLLYDMIGVVDLGGDCRELVQKIRALGVYSLAFSGAGAVPAQELSGAIGLVLAGGDAAGAKKFEPLGLPTLKIGEGEQAGDKLEAFIGTCGADRSWNMHIYAKEAVDEIKAKVGDGKVLLALSGGVDSSVCAALIERAVGGQLSCIFVDTGLMRKNEADEVQAAFEGKGLHLVRVEGEARFLAKLTGITDPEQKRKIIGEEFIRVFEEEAKKIGRVDFFAQGTIYADLLESGIGAKHVKSHHNVGGLPEHVDFKEIIEPLRTLFKHEVRELGAVLGLPEELVQRQPFPGPGLGVRVIGELKKERLDTLREADHIFRTEMKNAGLHREVAQYFAVLTDMQSVGVRDGGRTYESTLALRAIHTGDYMTGRWARLPHELLELVSARIVAEVPGINRVVYDITSKPPATIEWE